MSEDQFDWEWWSGPDEEFYRCGPHKSREDAIAEASSDYCDNSHIYVIEAVRAEWGNPDADDVIERMMDRSEDLFPEDYPELTGTVDLQREAKAELQARLDEWMSKWRDKIFPAPQAFLRSRNADRVPVEQEDAA